jgi:GH15 family glucan-1,4-alpha-glucosidase
METFTKSEKKELKKIYKTSLKIIDSMTLKNGAIMASPPGTRYPYVYPRDTALILRMLLEQGRTRDVKRTLTFLMKAQKETGEWAQRYNVDGSPASYRPPQVDCNGLVLYVMRRYFEETGDKGFLEKHWRSILLGIEFIKEHYIPEDGLIFSLNSIHEWPPMEAGFDIWANVTCYAGLRGGYKMAQALDKKDEAENIRNLARDLWIGISKKLIKEHRFIKVSGHIKITDPDVSEMAPYITRSIGIEDTIMKNTVRNILEVLWDKELGGVNRYVERYGEPGRNNGGYGPYSMYTGWVAQYYLDLGEYDKARECIKWFLKYNRDGLIPEHISTKERFNKWRKQAKEVGRYKEHGRREAAEKVMNTPEYKRKGLIYWVLPLTWGHAEYIKMYMKLKEHL